MCKLKFILKIFLCAQALLLAQSAWSFTSVDTSKVQSQANITPNMILHYINEYRAQRHLSPLKMNTMISAEAVKHSQDMARKTIPFGHRYFDTRIKHVYKEIKECRAGAENVAYYKTNAKKLVDAWIASPGHRQNIVGNFNVTGIGIAYGKKGWAYYTQIFVRREKV